MIKKGLLVISAMLLMSLLVGLKRSLSAEPTRPPAGNILMFVAYNDVWWAEYKVLYEGLLAAGYSVDVRSSGTGVANTYGSNIETSANNRATYAGFIDLFATDFGSPWQASWNTPQTIPLNGRIQDVVDLSSYAALVIPGGTGARNYRYDGTYSTFGPVGHQTTAAEVQAAAEKINQLVNEALQTSKPVGSQCHGATIVPFARLDGTAGQGFDGLGRSVLQGGFATAYHLGDGDSVAVYADLGITFLPDETLVIDGPAEADLGSLNGQDMIVTTRDWYPQTVAYFGRTILNMLTSYPTAAERAAPIDVLVYGGFEPNLYSGGEPGFSPALYTDVTDILNDPSDDFNFTATAQLCNGNINAASLAAYDVVLDFCHINISTANENALEQYVDDGGGLVGLHHAIWNPSSSNPIIIDLFGGELAPSGLNLQYYGSENRLINVNMGEFVSTWGVSLTAGQPTTSTQYTPAAAFAGTLPNANIDGDNARGYWHFTIPANDELYLSARFNAGSTFGRGVNEINRLFANDWQGDAYDYWGWTRLYDQDGDGQIGRIVYLEPGETLARTFAHPSYVQTIKNAVLWTTLDRTNPTPTPTPTVTATPVATATPTATPPPLSTLSDEFESAATFGDWVLGNSAEFLTFDIDTTNSGNLTIIPNSTAGNAWFNNGEAPMFSKLISGDFLVITHVTAGNTSNPSAPPTGQYQSAGLIARDPAGDTGNEDHVFYSLGHETNASGVGTDMRTTDNGNSTLNFMSSAGVNSGQLALCRVGDAFTSYRRLDGDAGWVATQAVARADLPTALQVGPAINSWSGADLYAQFEYVRFVGVPSNSAECLTLLTSPTSVALSNATTNPTTNLLLILLTGMTLAIMLPKIITKP